MNEQERAGLAYLVTRAEEALQAAETFLDSLGEREDQ